MEQPNEKNKNAVYMFPVAHEGAAVLSLLCEASTDHSVLLWLSGR